MAIIIPTFPVLPGLSFPVKRRPTFQTIEHRAVSGGSTTQSPQPYASYSFDLPYEFLRADNFTLEAQTLMSFYTGRKGKGLPFHFLDPDDNIAVGQVLGLGDGVTTDFALIRSMVNDADPIQDATFGTLAAFVNGAGVAFDAMVTSQYGTIYGVHFHVAPALGTVVSASFHFTWLCRFDEDFAEFAMLQYLNGKPLWDAKSIKFSTVIQ